MSQGAFDSAANLRRAAQRFFARITRALISDSSPSVASSNSVRLRVRSSASNGLRQTTSRSPGYSSLVISAMSC